MSERRAGLENSNAGADPPHRWGRPPSWNTSFPTEKGEARCDTVPRSRRGIGDGMLARKPTQTREAPAVAACDRQRDAREGQARPCGVTERPVGARIPGNAGGAKGPQFGHVDGRDKGAAIGFGLATLWSLKRPGRRLYWLAKMLITFGQQHRGPTDEVRPRAGCGKTARPVR